MQLSGSLLLRQPAYGRLPRWNSTARMISRSPTFATAVGRCGNFREIRYSTKAPSCGRSSEHNLPGPWQKTYLATNESEMLQAYEEWAPTYDEDSVCRFGYSAPQAAAAALTTRFDPFSKGFMEVFKRTSSALAART